MDVYLLNVFKHFHLFMEGLKMFRASSSCHTCLSTVLLNTMAMVEHVSTMQFLFR